MVKEVSRSNFASKADMTSITFSSDGFLILDFGDDSFGSKSIFGNLEQGKLPQLWSSRTWAWTTIRLGRSWWKHVEQKSSLLWKHLAIYGKKLKTLRNDRTLLIYCFKTALIDLPADQGNKYETSYGTQHYKIAPGCPKSGITHGYLLFWISIALFPSFQKNSGATKENDNSWPLKPLTGPPYQKFSTHFTLIKKISQLSWL